MPARLSRSMFALRTNLITVYPTITIGWIGDADHQQRISGHNPDDTPGVRAELEDTDVDQEVRAIDLMTGAGFTNDDAERVVVTLLNSADCRRRLYYIIWGTIVWHRSNNWKPAHYDGTPHTHVHISGWALDDDNGANWYPILALGESTVSKQDVIDALNEPVPWQSGGVRQLAIAYGDNPDGISTRRILEYVLAWTRYGERKLPVLTEQDINNIVDAVNPSTVPIANHTHVPGGVASVQVK